MAENGIDLGAALNMFQQGVQQYAVSSGVNEASQAVDQLNQQQMDMMQKRTAQKQIADRLALQLTGMGANAAQVQNAHQAIAPPTISGPNDLYMQAMQSGDPKALDMAVKAQKFWEQPLDNKMDKQLRNNLQLQELKNDNALEVAGLKGSGKAQKDLIGRFDNMGKALDPDQMRGGNFAKSKAALNAYDRVNTLFQQFPDYNVPENQTNELATSIASLISGSSPQSQHQIDSLTPRSLRGNSQKLAAWITNNPVGLEQQAFMKNMHDTAKREGVTAINQLRATQDARLSQYQDLKEKDPATYQRIYDAHVGRFDKAKEEILSTMEGVGKAPNGAPTRTAIINGKTTQVYLKPNGKWAPVGQ